MLSNSEIEIAIPIDIDGFIILKCSLCGEFFKIRSSDYEGEEIISVWCPSCGLQADNYMTDDVIELALTRVKNIMMDSLREEMKKIERGTKAKTVSFKAGTRPKKAREIPLMHSIDNLEIVIHPCCKKEVKVASTYKSIGSYCPFCGVRNG